MLPPTVYGHDISSSELLQIGVLLPEQSDVGPQLEREHFYAWVSVGCCCALHTPTRIGEIHNSNGHSGKEHAHPTCFDAWLNLAHMSAFHPAAILTAQELQANKLCKAGQAEAFTASCLAVGVDLSAQPGAPTNTDPVEALQTMLDRWGAQTQSMAGVTAQHNRQSYLRSLRQ